MAECFICMETENQLYKVCRCDTLVHASCLVHLVNNTPSHSTNCPVCMQVYDISVTQVRRWEPITGDSNFVCIALVIFTAVLGISVGIIIFIDSNMVSIVSSKNILFFSILKGASIGVAGTAVICIVMVMINHFRATGYVCCYAPVNIVTSREINLTNSRPVQIRPVYIDELEA